MQGHCTRFSFSEASYMSCKELNIYLLGPKFQEISPQKTKSVKKANTCNLFLSITNVNSAIIVRHTKGLKGKLLKIICYFAKTKIFIIL